MNDATSHSEDIRSKGTWSLLAVSAVAAIWALVWLQGEPFFTDDYVRWLKAAHDASWPQAILAVLNPWGGTDASWGFAYRPVIVVLFKLFGLSGWSSSLFFFVKGALFTGLVSTAYAAARRVTGSAWVAAICPVLLLTSHGVFESLAWGGDMAVLADLSILVALWLTAVILCRPHNTGWHVVALLAVTLLDIQTKGNGRLLAPILLVALAIGGRAGRRRLALPAVASVLIAVPMGALLHHQPFPLFGARAIAPGEGYTWHAASLQQVYETALAGTGWVITHPAEIAISLGGALWPLGWLAAGIALLALVARFAMGRTEPVLPSDAWGRVFAVLVAVWFVLALAATASYPAINSFYRHRYVIDLLVPNSILLAMGVGWAWRFSSFTWRTRLVALVGIVAVAQMGFGLVRLLTMRWTYTTIAVIADTLNHRMAEQRDAPVRLYMGDFEPYEYWPDLPGRQMRDSGGLEKLPVGSCVYSWTLPLVPDYELIASSDGFTGAWIERFYWSAAKHGFLLRRIVPSAELVRGRALATEGHWSDAVPLLTVGIGGRDLPADELLLGRALVESGHPSDAVPILSRLAAKELIPPRAVRYVLALALLKSDSVVAATTLYEALVREDQSDIDSMYNLGVAYRRAGQLDKARISFTRVLARNPRYGGALANMAELSAHH